MALLSLGLLVNDWLVGPRGHVDEPIGGRRQIGKSDVYNFGSSVAAVAAVQGWGDFFIISLCLRQHV